MNFLMTSASAHKETPFGTYFHPKILFIFLEILKDLKDNNLKNLSSFTSNSLTLVDIKINKTSIFLREIKEEVKKKKHNYLFFKIKLEKNFYLFKNLFKKKNVFYFLKKIYLFNIINLKFALPFLLLLRLLWAFSMNRAVVLTLWLKDVYGKFLIKQ